MEQSILKSTKTSLGVGDDDPSFDPVLINHINSAFSTLNDLGVGPDAGFAIEDETAEWATYLPDEEDLPMLSKVKTAVWLEVRLLFDPPTVGFLLDSMQRQLEQAHWRLNVRREMKSWVDPDPEEVLLVDGGDPSGE